MSALPPDHPNAVALSRSIRAGDLDALAQLLSAGADVASTWIVDSKGAARTPLHLVTDWPGYVPNGPAAVRLLLDAGADPNAAPSGGRFAETPLHWAASTDDVEVGAALIDGGADLEAPGGSIAGTPLGNAVGYGCWHVARLLVARGARVDSLWQAAALGMTARVEEFLAADPPPLAEEIGDAFWQACHGGQRRSAERLLAAGAELDHVPSYAPQTPLDISGALDTRKETMGTWLRALGASSAGA